MELTLNEIYVLKDIIDATMDAIEDEPWWPKGDWHDEDQRYMMQKHEVCKVLSQKLVAHEGDLDPKILQVIEDLTRNGQQ